MSNRGKRSRNIVAGLLGAALMLGAAACGGGSNSGAAVGNVGALSGSAKTVAEKAAAQSVKALGGRVSLPSNITVGILQIDGSSETAVLGQNAMVAAIKTIGWKYIACDAEGDPTKMVSCAQSLLNDNVNFLAGVAVAPSIILQQLKEAKARHIPYYNFLGNPTPNEPPSPLVAATYGPNANLMTQEISAFAINALEKSNRDKTVAVQYNAGVPGVAIEHDIFLNALKKYPNIKVVAQEQTNLADPNSVSVDARTVLTEYPHLGLYFTCTDFEMAAVAAVAKAVIKGQLPLITGFYAIKPSLAAIAAGTGTAVISVPTEATAWITIDQMAESLARHARPSQQSNGTPSIYPLNFLEPTVVSKANLPPAGQYPTPPYDFVTYFTTKWKLEFGR
jgi:ribose transport system substrate-binding protein